MSRKVLLSSLVWYIPAGLLVSFWFLQTPVPGECWLRPYFPICTGTPAKSMSHLSLCILLALQQVTCAVLHELTSSSTPGLTNVRFTVACSGASAQRVTGPPHSLRFVDHTQWHTTVGRTPLDEWSARRRDLYLTTHRTWVRQTSVTRIVSVIENNEHKETIWQ
jgi:hypothetical protein